MKIRKMKNSCLRILLFMLLVCIVALPLVNTCGAFKLSLTSASWTFTQEAKKKFIDVQMLAVMRAFHLIKGDKCVRTYKLSCLPEARETIMSVDECKEFALKSRNPGVWIIAGMKYTNSLGKSVRLWKASIKSPAYPYPFERVGSDKVLYKDDVLFIGTPKKDDVAIDDFFVEGGHVDTPPLHIAEIDDVRPLAEKFFEKYRFGAYVCVLEKSRELYEQARPPPLPYPTGPEYISEFATESYEVEEIPELYESTETSISKDFYVVPIGEWLGQKVYAGLQTFFIREAPECFLDCKITYGRDRVDRIVTKLPVEKLDSAKLNELAQQADPSLRPYLLSAKDRYSEIYALYTTDALQTLQDLRGERGGPSTSIENCRVCCQGRYPLGIYVDKVFFDSSEFKEAVEADWLIINDRATFTSECTPLSETGILPIEVDFDYEVLSRDVEKATVRFEATSNSSIVSYEWDFGDGSRAQGRVVEHTYKLGQYTVMLKVKDSDGRERRIIKTIDLGKVIEFKIWADNASLGEKTFVHTRCSAKETISVYIDKVNESLEKESAIIEAQPIPCNADMLIGPFNTAGRYVVRGVFGEIEKESGFTIS